VAATQANEGILIGGPRDQGQVETIDAAIIHLQVDNLVHRYIRTGQRRTVGGRSLLVYNYDGEERLESFRSPPG
jgi:hypothetical protein